jgi:hypothetical protein
MAAAPGNFTKLPPGWKARVVTLQEDNHEVPAGGVASIVADEFFNVYDKTGPGMTICRSQRAGEHPPAHRPVSGGLPPGYRGRRNGATA